MVFYERLHELGIVNQYGVESVSIQLQGEDKQWLRAYMDVDLLHYLQLFDPITCLVSGEVCTYDLDRSQEGCLWHWSKVVGLWMLMWPSFRLYPDMLHSWLLLRRTKSSYLLEV